MTVSRALAAILAVAYLAACAGPVAPDLVIVNAKVFTNDTARPWAEAVAIKGERVIGVGSSADVRGTAGPTTRVVGAGGRVLVPGFNDARVDLPLEVPTPAALTALDRDAVAKGVTSLQVIAGGPMRTLVVAAQQAQRQARWRVIRSPEDTATLSTADPTQTTRQDEKPYLPPQPGERLHANGIAWRLEDGHRQTRRALADDRVATVVGWAYGAEDPLVMAGAGHAWLEALGRTGLEAVWRRKRPRFDIVSPFSTERPGDFAGLGVTITWTPAALTPEPPSLSRPYAVPSVFVDAGAHVALGSAGAPDPMGVLHTATTPSRVSRERPLSRDEAARAMTWGSAYAEKAERDKGWLAPGTLADLAVLSDDIFTVAPDRLPGITSVLTLVGGTIVYDSGVLPK